MAYELQDSFDQVVPGAADKAGLFLKVVRDRAHSENLGLTFVPRTIRKTGSVILEANLQLGKAFRKGTALKLTVHADPIGNSLQVGWQLAEEAPSAIAQAVSRSVATGYAMASLRNYSPENQRILNGILGAFHQVAFLPVLAMLVEAIESSRPRGDSGFLGV